MAITAVALLLVFALNMWLALTALQAIATGIVRMYGRSYRRELENHEFWFSVAAKAAAAIIFFLYLTSVVHRLAEQGTAARTSVTATKKA